MFGIYENLPHTFHGVAQLTFSISKTSLQKSIIRSFYQLNIRKWNLNLSEFTRYNIKADLEVGIADGVFFNFIDKGILNITTKKTKSDNIQFLDFIFIARYYMLKKDSKRPLRFDYYLARFTFNNTNMEIQIFHDKGIRRLTIDKLIKYIIDAINKELIKKRKNVLNLKYLRTL